MAIVRVQSNPATLAAGSSNTLSVTLGSTATAGNILIVCAGAFLGGALTVTDNLSSTYATAASASDTTNVRSWAGVFYLANIPSGITSVTVSGFNFSPGGINAIEYSGIVTSSPLDKTSANNAGFATAAFTSNATATTSQSGELAFGFESSADSVDGAFSGINGAWTTFSETGPTANGHYIFGEQRSAGIAAYTFSGSNSGTVVDNTAIVATFLPSATFTWLDMAPNGEFIPRDNFEIVSY